GPSREELEREAARELERAGGGSGSQSSVGGWSPPSLGAPLMPEEPGAGEPAGTGDLDDGDEYEDEEAVTELALSWLADQDRPGGKRSLEDMVVRVDASSATAARDRALQEHMERQAMLKKAQVTAPWAQKKLTVGEPFSTRRAPLRDQPGGRPAKKAKKKAKKKKKALAKKTLAKKVVAKKAVAKKATVKKAPNKKAPNKKAPNKKAVAKKATVKRTARVTEVGENLPIEDYDRLTAEQIVAVLDDLEDDELDLVADYEEQHRNRAQVLNAIDDLFEDEPAPPGQAATARAADDDLPIEDYDRLTAEQIVAVLDDLEDDALDLVAEYEEQHRNRAQILDAIDDLFEEGPAPPAKKSPAGKATGKKSPAKKAPAKKSPAKKALAKKSPAKKAPAKKSPAKKSPARTTVKKAPTGQS
nr:hypothetical protein [Actinomycetota bacterium]